MSDFLEELPKALNERERAALNRLAMHYTVVARALALIDALTEQGAQQAAQIVLDGQRIAELESRLDVKRRQYETAFRERAEAFKQLADAKWPSRTEAEQATGKAHDARVRALTLADANALLGRLGVWADTYGAALVPHGPDTYGDGVRACKTQVKAILAAQPAAPSRTEAEQAVLDAMGEFKTQWMREQLEDAQEHMRNPRIRVMCTVFEAELARRGLK